MGKSNGFMTYARELPRAEKPQERVQHFGEFYLPHSLEKTREQAARCMDCGVPFCHHGCPLGNHIPDFNEAVYEENWERAIHILHTTNNFPEFTGRICPAPCEGSCVLGINHPPVAIEHIEKTLTEKAFELGLIKANVPTNRTGKKVAVVGSGPAGLAAAAQLNQAGHTAIVFERDAYPGGLLRYGIPDFKLEKWVVERRINLLEEEGVVFRCKTEIGKDISWAQLQAEHDAVILCTGAPIPRDMGIEGRELIGIHFAMEYLTQANREVAAEPITGEHRIHAKEKHVIVIGGGDTGSDCIGTANRQQAASIMQITWGPQPPEARASHNPWPEMPAILQTTSSQEEGCEREWNVLAQRFEADASGQVCALHTVDIQWNPGRKGYKVLEGSERRLPCDLALIAVGFTGAETSLLQEMGLEPDAKNRVKAPHFQTALEGVFAAGDNRRGQSLVVWAIAEGRDAAQKCDDWLKGI